MTATVKAADLPVGSVVLFSGVRWTKQWQTPGGEWTSSLEGVTGNWYIDKLLGQFGAAVVACCDQYGIGDHDSAEHGDE